ncbi:metallophosphoesterase [Paludibaculum fermentans]|uniref:Metallophosphoesterase n=1 Tax=Paludibaculum fermentans TaxID=1473598 RepID=A0A7S7NQ31_PALFE|nr:metallophosphoesterase [Paludibaculum fermentans]QOY87701.1 metallophosphoesterase [Paludibaculum fermentans]
MHGFALFLGVAMLAQVPVSAQQPLFSFGAIADVQYADKDDAIGRQYRVSTAKLAACANLLNRERLEFVVHLGDLIDEGAGNLEVIRKVYGQIQAPRYYVLGNHDFTAGRSTLMSVLGLNRPYYDFSVKGWTFVVLDGMNESVAGGWPEADPHAQAGRATLDALKKAGLSNAQSWNGAVGPAQRRWLQETLARAAGQGNRVIVFSHFPVLAASCRPEHLLWDHEEVLRILEASSATAAYLNGHDHKGGAALHSGIPYVTLPGMVEHAVNESCQVVDVYPDGLVVRQAGAGSGRSFPLR